MTRSVGVIVVNWNGGTDTADCLASLRTASPAPSRVVVIDNASSDDSVARVRAWARSESLEVAELPARSNSTGPLAWLTLIHSPENLGFSGANNEGIALLLREGAVDDILLLNNDATVAPDFFQQHGQAVAALGRDALILGSTIYHSPEIDRVWYSGGRVFPLRALVTHELERPIVSGPRPTDFVTGCAMYITGAAVHRLGFLAECYAPGYMEDAEYCWRAPLMGVGVYLVPGAIVFHRVGTSFDKVPSNLVTYTKNRNRVFFVRRNLRGVQRLGALTYLALTKPARALLELLKGRRDQATAIIRGTLEGFRSSEAEGASLRVTSAPTTATALN